MPIHLDEDPRNPRIGGLHAPLEALDCCGHLVDRHVAPEVHGEVQIDLVGAGMDRQRLPDLLDGGIVCRRGVDATQDARVRPLADQQLAGLMMWVPAILPYLAAGLWLAWSDLRPVEPAA